MKETNMVWSIIWTIFAALLVFGYVWRPAHFVAAVLSIIIAGLFWYDYYKTKDM